MYDGEVLHQPHMAMLRPRTGIVVPPMSDDTVVEFLNSEVKSGERYSLSFDVRNNGDGESYGHVVNIFRVEGEQLIIYDPQHNETYTDINSYSRNMSLTGDICLLRTDDLAVNPTFAEKIIKGRR